MSFVDAIREHKRNQAQRRKELDQTRAATVSSLETTTGTLLNDVSRAVYTINVNQQRIESELKGLQTMTNNFNKNVSRWLSLYKDLNEGLKQLGDVANWASVIEADMRFICRVLDNSAALMTGQQPSSGPATSETSTAVQSTTSSTTAAAADASSAPIDASLQSQSQ